MTFQSLFEYTGGGGHSYLLREFVELHWGNPGESTDTIGLIIEMRWYQRLAVSRPERSHWGVLLEE